MSIRVRGRKLTKPRYKFTHYPKQSCLRIDDDGNPEFWLEVWFDNADLHEILDDADSTVEIGEDQANKLFEC